MILGEFFNGTVLKNVKNKTQKSIYKTEKIKPKKHKLNIQTFIMAKTTSQT